MSEPPSIPIEDMDPAYVAENNIGLIMGVGWTFHVLAYAFVSAKVYTRLIVVKSFGWDDAMMVLTMLSLTAGAMIPQTVSVFHGLGHHRDTIGPEDLKIYFKMTFIQALIASVSSLGFLKLSIALALLRLSINRWYKRTLYALMVFIVAYILFGWLTVGLWCFPVRAQWDREIPGAKCYPKELLYTFAVISTSCNIFTDVCFATLPIPIIWGLQMKQRTRIYLISIFSLGYIVVVVGLLKAYVQVTTRSDPDTTFYDWIRFFGLLQQNLGIIAACSPSLKPLFNKALKLTSVGYYGNRSGYGNHYHRQSRGYIKSNGQGGPDEFELHNSSRNSRAPFGASAASRSRDRSRGDFGTETFDDSYHTSVVAGSTLAPSSAAVSGVDSQSLAERRAKEKTGVMRTTEITVT